MGSWSVALRSLARTLKFRTFWRDFLRVTVIRSHGLEQSSQSNRIVPLTNMFVAASLFSRILCSGYQMFPFRLTTKVCTTIAVLFTTSSVSRLPRRSVLPWSVAIVLHSIRGDSDQQRGAFRSWFYSLALVVCELLLTDNPKAVESSNVLVWSSLCFIDLEHFSHGSGIVAGVKVAHEFGGCLRRENLIPQGWRVLRRHSRFVPSHMVRFSLRTVLRLSAATCQQRSLTRVPAFWAVGTIRQLEGRASSEFWALQWCCPPVRLKLFPVQFVFPSPL